jgi:glycosyltransferase involved in cell wall biosynthesis
MLELEPSLRVEIIPNGADFEEFAGLPYTPGDRFRITHAGSFFGRRDPRPFLEALGRVADGVVARFVGDFRAADRAWAERRGLGDRLELLPYQPRSRTLRLERDTEALLLLLPELGSRGRDIPSAKLFEYLAARRPILAAAPVDGAAADLVREANAGIVVPPADTDAIQEALEEQIARWRTGTLELAPMDEALRRRIDRRSRSAELAALLETVA